MPTSISQAPAIPKSSTGLAYPRVLGWSLRQHIGGGGFSKVFTGYNASHPTHKTAAIKVVSLLRNPPPDRRALQKEVQIHTILKHAHILTFLGVQESGVSTEERGKYLPGIYMVLELAGGGDLFDKITPDAGVETDLAHFYFTQLISGLEYIHSQGIAHRDIKPENMLLNDEGNLKIADFGLCSVYKHKGREREMKGACGSLPYIAPEMNGRPYKGEPVDVWSAGVVLFALLVGNTPWDEPTSRAPEYVAYLNGTLFEYHPWNTIPGDEMSLLKGMMQPDPAKRLSLEAIKRHRWYKRSNPLLAPKTGQCTDPASLAERLLQGLIFHGEMDYVKPLSAEERARQLHSDGARAELPENISLTQPEAMQRGSLHLGSTSSAAGMSMLPTSTAQPRVSSSRHDSLSQQFLHRRNEFVASQAQGGTSAPSASQFTDAMNYMTQPGATPVFGAGAGPSGYYQGANLTRFYSTASVSIITRLLSKILHEMRVQHEVEPLGDTVDDGEDGAPPRPEPRKTGEMADMDIEPTTSTGASGGLSRTSSTLSNATITDSTTRNPMQASTTASSEVNDIRQGSRGTRIRVSLMDRRKCPLKGEIRIETVSTSEAQTAVLMRRSRGNPLEWRRMFGQIVKRSEIGQYIVRN
ncbi:unnamed protein product [Sympodiomycopsis kandeliae]